MMNKLLSFLKRNEELISYLLWGVLTTVVSWGSYSLCVWILEGLAFAEITAISISNVLSWLFAMIFAFVVNKLFVFKSKSWEKRVFVEEAVKFVTTRLATGGLELILVPALVFLGLDQTILGIQGMVSKILVSILVVVLNYIFSKLFIFKKAAE